MNTWFGVPREEVPWFPVIDADKCTGCRSCVDFCENDSVLAMRPMLAILDEPDSGIDALSVSSIVNVIRTLAKNGSSVLLITHLEEVAATTDRASSLCSGTILRTGEPREVARFFRNHCMECPAAEEPTKEAFLHA